MALKHCITAALIGTGLVTAVATAAPASAYTIRTTGQTRATPRLAADVLTTVSRYSKATGSCSFVFSADMRIMPTDYTPTQRVYRVRQMGGHYELWLVNACARKQVFEVAMWPSPRGGSDFAVVPVTGTMPLHTQW